MFTPLRIVAKRRVRLTDTATGLRTAASRPSLAEADPNVGVMLTFGDFLEGIERFGTQVMPLIKQLVGLTAG
jgi:hypothetical protein